jgi:hypothetical protein
MRRSRYRDSRQRRLRRLSLLSYSVKKTYRSVMQHRLMPRRSPYQPHSPPQSRFPDSQFPIPKHRFR